jgi:hypothetical protein
VRWVCHALNNTRHGWFASRSKLLWTKYVLGVDLTEGDVDKLLSLTSTLSRKKNTGRSRGNIEKSVYLY